MSDVAMIGVVYEDLKISKDIIKGILALRPDTAIQEKAEAAVRKIGETQDILFTLQETIFALHVTNEDLRRELIEVQNWKANLDQYTLTRSVGGAMVYQSRFEPLHYACPNCISGKVAQILQDMQDGHGTYVCYHCKSYYAVGPITAASPQYAACYSL